MPEEDTLIRFAVDAMLGRLARWLRLAGLDTLYQPSIEDDELIARASRERRVLITRDRALARRARKWGLKVIIPVKEGGIEQLLEICSHLGLDENTLPWYERCTQCNKKVVKVPRQKVRDLVPYRVWKKHRSFYCCPSCQKVFWSGSHIKAVDRIRAVKRRRTETYDE